jgi:glycosyltransferase involved in cell wall biosynthesis
MKRLLLDVTTVTNEITGVSRYGMELVRTIIDSKDLDLTLITYSKLDPDHELYKIIQGKNVKTIPFDVPAIGPKRELLFFKLRLKLKNSFDVFHSVTSNAPMAFFNKGVGTFHDIKYILFPRFMGENWFIKSSFIKFQFAFICFFYRKITCSSQSTLNDLCNAFPWMRNRILSKAEVVYLGLTPLEVHSQLKAPAPINDPYFIYVGELRPHKNVPNMIKAFEKFAVDTNFKGHLLIGGKAHKTSDVMATDSRVKFLGRVHDDDLGILYANALALFFATRYEGFGLPILEAMHLDTPVITSTVSSMPEVGGDAAILVDPDNIDQMVEALKTYAYNPEERKRRIEMGRVQASKFSWQKCASEMVIIYRSI